MKLQVGIENAAIAHDCRVAVIGIHVGKLTLHLNREESPISDIRLDLEATSGIAREGVGP